MCIKKVHLKKLKQIKLTWFWNRWQ